MDHTRVPPPNPGPVRKVMWVGAGFTSVGVGSVGLVVPGLPTTVFFVFAAWCFSRSSPRFEQWVLDLPTVGPMVRDYRAGLGMPRRSKLVAVTMMWSAITISSFVLRDRWWLVATVVALGAIGTYVVVWRVPTKPEDPRTP